VMVAGVALVLCAPLMLLIAILVKLSSPGPVFFTQTRVGLDRRNGDDPVWQGRRKVDYGGRLFTIYKFRTMRAEENSALQIWAKPGDSRVTPIGKVLRKYRLDELPQLVNVLKGDMNIVGPRPEQPRIFGEMRQEIALYACRQRVLPGITGWAQVNLTYDTSIDDVRTKVRYDLEYIGRASAFHDLYILLRTVPVVLLRKGAW
jgi:lipopolysaccharide/colanic/teichoic acid biosynthesis glycosyltransferase